MKTITEKQINQIICNSRCTGSSPRSNSECYIQNGACGEYKKAYANIKKLGLIEHQTIEDVICEEKPEVEKEVIKENNNRWDLLEI